MTKISKSDLPIDRRTLDERLADHFKHKTQHFKIGTKIKVAHKAPGTILLVTIDRTDGLTALTVEWEDGSVSSIKPFALNRRNQ